MCSDTEFFRPLFQRIAPGALLLLAMTTIVGCGHKAPPQPPPNMAPQATQEISLHQRGHQLQLEFAYPQVAVSGLALPGISAVEVWRLVTPVPETLLDGDFEEFGSDLGEEMGSEVDDEKIAPATESVPEETESALEDEGGEASQSEDEATDESEDEEGDPEETGPSLEAQLKADPREFAAAALLIETLEGTDLQALIIGDRIAITLALDEPLPETLEVHNLAVRTVSTDGKKSAMSKHIALVPRQPAAAPQALATVAQDRGIELTWTIGAEELTGLRVFRREIRTDGFDQPLARIAIEAESYLDQTAIFGHDYAYSITAVSQDAPLIESPFATPAVIRYEDLFPPKAPQRLVALAGADGVRLLWESVAAIDVEGYVVYRQERGTELARITETPVAESEFIDSNVSAGRTYTYVVRAIDEAGNLGPPSGTVDARP